ncbi:hypothetical protein EC957_004217 [Mortierella hygrophila]|uniref:DUF7905 domain-containing protein n=1 Tax=Mortierella hygrophila TaxID=979708 RepID=A0A9P6FFH9_9FUNG|nr:hypothetical protein EC957_004217 [Mortierella hygrophila]
MDYDDADAQEWQNTFAPPTQAAVNNEYGPCDDYWFIPPYTDINDLEDHLVRISRNTDTRAVHNREKERIDLWGTYKNIQSAKAALDHMEKFYHGRAEKKQKATRTKGWARPERELTPAEQKKKDREIKRQQERQKYLGEPTEEFPFTHCIAWPKEVPIFRYLGGKLERLDALRAEFQSFIWIDKAMNLYVAGGDEGATMAAMGRVKNFLIKVLNRPSEHVCHVLEKPSKLVQIHIVPNPPAPYISPNQGFHGMQGGGTQDETKIRYLKAKEVGDFGNVREVDLRMSAIDSGNRNGDAASGTNGEHTDIAPDMGPYVRPMQYSERMTQRNIDRIRHELEGSLEAVQLMDYDVKMRIRIGQVGLLIYPKQTVWEIADLDTAVIPDGRLRSEFSPYFIKSSGTFAAAERRITPPDNGEQSVEPDEVWFLHILRRDEETQETINVTLEVTFRSDGNAGLWNGLVQQTTPLDIRVISSERRLSWAWTVSAGKRHSDQSLEAKFVRSLHLQKESGRDSILHFANTDDVQLRHVRREKKKLIVRDQWTIEMTEEAFWTMEKPFMPYQINPLNEPPSQVLYSLSMYRDSWKSRFSENPYLGLGQVPTWEPEDFFKGEEAIEKTLEAVSEVRSLIEGLY